MTRTRKKCVPSLVWIPTRDPSSVCLANPSCCRAGIGPLTWPIVISESCYNKGCAKIDSELFLDSIAKDPCFDSLKDDNDLLIVYLI